jgi:hypothetical protein
VLAPGRCPTAWKRPNPRSAPNASPATRKAKFSRVNPPTLAQRERPCQTGSGRSGGW